MAWCRKSESENLGGNKIFENAESENNFEVEKVGHNNSIIWYHKDSESIQVDPNHTNINQPIPSNSKNIGSINDSADIRTIENILSSTVHLVHVPSPLPAPLILTYGTSSDA